MPAIWLLALDTSTPLTALALGRVDRERGASELVASATHDDQASPASSLLAARIAALLAGADLASVDAVYLRASYAELGTNTPRRAPHRSPFV